MNEFDGASLSLEDLLRAGFISSGDAHFARFCSRAEADPPRASVQRLVFAAVSRALRQGHACLPLSSLDQLRVDDVEGEPMGKFPSSGTIEAALESSTAIERRAAGLQSDVLSRPLVMDELGRLYLSRYFEHEQILAHGLVGLLDARRGVETPPDDWMEKRLDVYFPPGDAWTDALQREAARLSLTSRLAVISGGPGTGKTSTVVKILALLGDQAEALGKTAPHVQLLAPTGKAAARMMEATLQALERLDLPEERRRRMLGEASTIHRALGVFPDNPTRYRRGPEQRLRADVVIVDEASMIDLALMRHLCQALKQDARLILLGDRHQLASVEAGSVMAELCDELSHQGAMVELARSFRFAEGSGIASLAQSVKEGDARACVTVLKSGREDLAYHAGVSDPAQSDALRKLVVERYRTALSAGGARQVLAALSGFRVLCAHRRGRFGVEAQNATIANWLVEAGVVPREARVSGDSRGAGRGPEAFYRGRPILITENDYGLGLHNGDVGIIWPNDEGKLAVAVIDEGDALRWLSPAQLPAHETAFALTIHKSQGSEYGEVAVILPDHGSPLLSRELVYTAVTRARTRVHLFGEETALVVAASQSVVRHSGLRTSVAAHRSALP